MVKGNINYLIIGIGMLNMLDYRLYIRLTRVNEYLLVLLFTFPLVFMLSGNALSTLTVMVFLANLFLTAFGYAFNDIEDAEDDYHDLEKRKRNPIASQELSRGISYVFSLLLVIAGLGLLWSINHVVFVLGLINVAIGFLYSWKPVRLKSRPFLDLLSHVFFLGTLQFCIIYLAFRPLDLYIVPFLMIIVPFSTMNELFHELIDYELDKKTNVINTVQTLNRKIIRQILIGLSIITVSGFCSIILLFPLANRTITLPISILIGVASTMRLYARIIEVKH